jgi:hypothetical protein
MGQVPMPLPEVRNVVHESLKKIYIAYNFLDIVFFYTSAHFSSIKMVSFKGLWT